MYPIENIIRNACPDKGRLSILVVNEANDDYIEVLANNLDHDFYLVGSISDFPQWGKKTKPTNVKIVASQHHIPNRYIDAIITFNRGMMCNKALDISNSIHCPSIVVDLVSGQSKVPAPLSSTITLDNPDELYLKNGDVSVGINEFVVRSWTSNIPSFNTEINYPGVEYQIQPARKVLVDRYFPKQSFDHLQIILDNNLYTTEISEASLYLHLWNGINTTLIDAMRNKIPVLITRGSPDLEYLVANQLCIVVDDARLFNTPDNFEKVMNFDALSGIVENAYQYVSKFTNEDFSNKWNNVLSHVSNKSFVRV
ncbi:MAG: hypothetical protein ACW97P_09710 [Candidatus Hodarchaeales archaeon]|jgi:hypothetical protein